MELWFASTVSVQLKTWRFNESRKFQENPWNTWIWWWVPSRPLERPILIFVLKSGKKSAKKHSIEKHILFNFLNLATIFYPRLLLHVSKCTNNLWLLTYFVMKILVTGFADFYFYFLILSKTFLTFCVCFISVYFMN